MRPRVLYELSRRLAILLESGLKEGGDGRRVPVFLCHPLDPMENRESLEASTVGILYPTRISPEPRLRHAGLSLETSMPFEGGRARWAEMPADSKDRLRMSGLWVKVRYAFLVAGGSVEDQLEAIGAALRTLHDHPYVKIDEAPQAPSGEGAPAESTAGGEPPAQAPSLAPGGTSDAGADPGADAFPVTLLDEGEGWRELGLAEHHLTISFEVTLCIPSERAEVVERVLERDLHLEEGVG
jgi:hypothetical protein